MVHCALLCSLLCYTHSLHLPFVSHAHWLKLDGCLLLALYFLILIHNSDGKYVVPKGGGLRLPRQKNTLGIDTLKNPWVFPI